MAPRGVVLLLLASLVLGFASAQIRGIDPTKAEKYSQSSGSFTCLDGSKTIPFDRVNDNYCDCPGDGSDEPGTSACYHGTFWCRNRGFEPQTISSSFVDDGVCDCCDGSDEIKECPNTCLEKSAHERQAIRDKVASFQRALDKKTQAEADAATLQKRWSERHQTIHTDIEAKEEEVRKLEAEKAQLDAEVDAERAKQAAEEEAKKQQAAGEEQQQQATEGTPAEHEETAEERGRRIASQWTHDPEAAGVPAGELGEEEGHMGEYQPLEEEQPHYDDHHDHDHYREEGLETELEDDLEPQPDNELSSVQPTPQPEGSTRESAQNPWVASMRSNWQEAQKELSSVRDDLGRYLKNEWEDFMRFVEVLKVAWGQVKEVWNDTVASGGGMKERQRRREAREKEHEAAAAARLQRSTEEIQKILADIKKARSEAAQANAQGAMEQGKQENEEGTSAGSAAAAAEVEQREASEPAAESAPAPAPTPALKPDPAPRPSAGRRDPMKRHQRRAAPAAWTPPPPPSPAQIAVNEVNGKLSSAKIALESLKEEKQKIDRYYVQRDSFDFGPNNVFLPLAGKCVSDVGSRWHYKACFFDKATQSEPHNMANVVTLGVWKGFNKDYSEAVFHNGDVCAGVGQRSFTVKLVCGEEEKMWGSEEPSTCVYAATMSTPVACKVADLEHEQRHLQELEAFEAEIRAEIEADRAKKAAASASDHTEL